MVPQDWFSGREVDWILASYRDGSVDLIHNLVHLTIQHNPPIARQSGAGQDALVDVQKDVLLLSWPPALVKGLQWTPRQD